MNAASSTVRAVQRTAERTIDGTPATLKPFLYIDDIERKRQQDVLLARKFHEGMYRLPLSDRMKDYLGSSCDSASLRLNIVYLVNMALAERLVVEGFDCEAEDSSKTAQNEFAARVWNGSRMKAHQGDVIEETVVDGEHFIIIDFDAENNRPRLTPHKRWTDPEVRIEGVCGDGEGVRMIYPNNDTSQKPIAAVKRWTEHYFDERGTPKSEQRMTVYFPDRAEKYVRRAGGWTECYEYAPDGAGNLVEQPWPMPMVDAHGEPLGIPVVHLRMPKLRPEAREAWGLQRALGKQLLDMLTAGDMTAFRIIITYGWEMLDTDGNPIAFAPGQNIGTTSSSQDASHEVVDGADLQQFFEAIDKTILYICAVTDTPAARFQLSGSVRAEGTLQEEKEGLVIKCQRRTPVLATAYEDAMRAARRWHNAFAAMADGAVELDEKPAFHTQWREFFARTVADRSEEAAALLASDVPSEVVWKRVWRFTDAEIEAMKKLVMGDMAIARSLPPAKPEPAKRPEPTK